MTRAMHRTALLLSLAIAQAARHYYLAPYIGTGQPFVDPFRPHGTDGVAGWAAIDLRPNPMLPGCCALLALPARADDPLRDYLGDALDGLEPGAKGILETKLGVTLQATRVRVGGERGGLRTITSDAGNHFACDGWQVRDINHHHAHERGIGRGIGRGMR